MSPKLVVDDGTFRYPGAPAPILEHIGVEVGDRELLAILGPNGSLFNGLCKPLWKDWH